MGVVVVQHMPPVFTKAFAERLDSCCAVTVKEAENGDPILPGRVLLAPGNWHMTVSRFGGEPRVLLNQKDTVNGHRPSVDVLMRSVAREYGPRAIGVIMTGMGKDGADGLHELRARGGHVIAQDKDSSVIYGMNKEVVQNGDAHEVVPVDQIASRLRDYVCAAGALQGRPYEAQRSIQPGEDGQQGRGDGLRGNREADRGRGGHVHLRGMRPGPRRVDPEPRHPALLHVAPRAPDTPPRH